MILLMKRIRLESSVLQPPISFSDLQCTRPASNDNICYVFQQSSAMIGYIEIGYRDAKFAPRYVPPC